MIVNKYIKIPILTLKKVFSPKSNLKKECCMKVMMQQSSRQYFPTKVCQDFLLCEMPMVGSDR